MEKRIVEINGIKMEIDLSQCKVIENYKVGDQVKVLKKDYSDYKSYPGVIIGFDDFKNLPTIIVAYLVISYSEAKVEFCYFNAQSKDIELCMANALDKLIDKSRALDLLNKEIIKKETELQELHGKKVYFLQNFNMYFGELKASEI